MAGKQKFNKLEHPLKSIASLQGQVPWTKYKHADAFRYVCTAEADRNNERLVITDSVAEDMQKSCVYAMVIDGLIFKIGTALRGIKGRIGSYNSGRTRYRVRGTNSSANYWVLQSLLSMQKPVLFYAFYPPVRQCEIFGETIDEPFPSAKSVEGVVIRQFEAKHGMKPLGCTQG